MCVGFKGSRGRRGQRGVKGMEGVVGPKGELGAPGFPVSYFYCCTFHNIVSYNEQVVTSLTVVQYMMIYEQTV